MYTAYDTAVHLGIEVNQRNVYLLYLWHFFKTDLKRRKESQYWNDQLSFYKTL